MLNDFSPQLKLIRTITEQFSKLETISAIALGGSLTGQTADQYSDIDLYVYSDQPVPLEFRKKIVEKLGAREANLGLTFWDEGDEWIHEESGIEVDLIYWNKKWIEGKLINLLDKFGASIGYSTSFWHTIKNSHILFDRSGWFLKLQSRYNIAYPQELKKAIISKNYPILRDIIPSYFNQIKKAIARNDHASINHRVAALLASYFDILFALNEIPNPGEKKINNFVLGNCSKIPKTMEKNVEEILISNSNFKNLLFNLDMLIDNLDNLLQKEGFNPLKIHW